MISMGSQSVSDVRAPVFRSVRQLNNNGLFELEVEIPLQLYTTRPVATIGYRRFYTLVLYLDGQELDYGIVRDFHEQSVATIRFTYTRQTRSILMGLVRGLDADSDMRDCDLPIVFDMTGFAINIGDCPSAILSNCAIEGKYGGVAVRSSGVQLLDCEMILKTGGTFIMKDESSSVYEQNVKKISV